MYRWTVYWRETPLLRFASGSADGGRTEIGTYQSMSALSQSERLRADTARTVQDTQACCGQFVFDEWTQNARLPLDGMCPVLKDQVVAFRQIVVERADGVAH